MNWGNKLVIVFIVFAAMMITLVYKSMHTKFELVSKDYYKDELRYQEKIDGKKNAAELSNVMTNQNDEIFEIRMPSSKDSGKITGEAWFYCGNNESKDRKIALDSNPGLRQRIPIRLLAKGDYQLKLSWQQNGKQYYHEANILIH